MNSLFISQSDLYHPAMPHAIPVAAASTVDALRHTATRRSANLAGVPAASFHRWKKRTRDITVAQLDALAAAHGFAIRLITLPDAHALDRLNARVSRQRIAG